MNTSGPGLFFVGNAISQSSLIPVMVNGVVGESVTLPLKFPAEENISMIIWSHNNSYITMCQPSGSPEVLIFNHNKKTNCTKSCSLHFHNLTRTDSGSYRAQIHTRNSDEKMFSNYVLRVFGRLHNLQVSHHIQLSGNGTCKIYLTCSVENVNDAVSFGWQLSENTSLSEPNLTVSWDSKDSRDQSYVCVAENPVSNLSCPVSAKNLCKGILTKENLQWKNLTLITVCVIFIIIIALILIYKKKTGSLHLPTQHSEPSENIELASISPGSTVYAHVTHPYSKMEIPTFPKGKGNDSVTIYSTINHSKQNKPTSPRTNAFHSNK
ncbi:PREDICTED: SLAM family member 6 isoform X2 [Chinchilla lanigera]|uniref:SLAM family member 6 isoform X2 n=1 Tax=Chinchilla lanigera TaxID=34839 RepID=UPI000695C506|nr:PREDICTED: SLAM family member 6 isoform X2 [Chinchilla lanigera]